MIISHQKKPIEVIEIFRKNLSNWKIISNSYNSKITFFLQPFANWLPNKSLSEAEKKSFEIHFPKAFTYFLKFLQILPSSIYFKLVSKGMKKIDY